MQRMLNAILHNLLQRFNFNPLITRDQVMEVLGTSRGRRAEFHGWLEKAQNLQSKETLFWLDSIVDVYVKLRNGEVLKPLPSEIPKNAQGGDSG